MPPAESCNRQPDRDSNGERSISLILTEIVEYFYNGVRPMALPVPNPRHVPLSSSLLDQIGNTPLLRLAKLDAGLPGVEIYGKAEFLNPGGSVKDRAGLNMILDGERSGRMTHDRTLLDATSGNTGIAYAMICA